MKLLGFLSLLLITGCTSGGTVHVQPRSTPVYVQPSVYVEPPSQAPIIIREQPRPVIIRQQPRPVVIDIEPPSRNVVPVTPKSSTTRVRVTTPPATRTTPSKRVIKSPPKVRSTR